MKTEDQINAEHKARYAEAIEKYGRYNIPWPVVQELGEITRQEWIRFYEGGATEAPKQKKDKTARLVGFVRDNPNRQVSPQEMVEATGAAIGTVYAFMNDNRSLFRKVGSGQYVIVDADAERAAAKGRARTDDEQRALASHSTSDATAKVDVAIVQRALESFHTDAPRVGKP